MNLNQRLLNASDCERNSFESNFEGLRAICLNAGRANLDMFKAVYNPDKHDVMIAFHFDGKVWCVSLYCDKPEIDCAAMAIARKGGGRKGAAGFRTKNIAEILPGIIE